MTIAERVRTFASGKIDRARILKETEQYNFWLNRPVAPDTVLYESFEGRSVSGNPEAIFRFLLKQQDLSHLKHVWAVADPTLLGRLSEEFASHGNVRFVKRNGSAYLGELATNQYLINNVGFPPEFVKREGQTYVHATDAVSAVSGDAGNLDEIIGRRNILRNMLAADFLVSGSAEMTEKFYAGSLQLTNIFQGNVIESGLPRDDLHQGFKETHDAIDTRFPVSASEPENRQIILIRPSLDSLSGSDQDHAISDVLHALKHLERHIDTSKFRLSVQLPQGAIQGSSTDRELDRFSLDTDIPLRRLLGLVDFLVTDQGLAHEVGSLGNAAILTNAWMADGSENTSLSSSRQGAGSRRAEELDALTRMVLAACMKMNDDENDATRWADGTPVLSDGFASKRVVDVVFRNQADTDHVRRLPEDGRTRVLLYPGGMVPNGITTSALNLLHNIDYKRFDVTVICPYSDDDVKMRMLAQINPKARLLFRDGRFTGGYAENKLRSLAMLGNTRARNLLGRRIESLWSREWERCFGGASFDHVLDFSGYSPFWGELFRHGNSGIRTIWMHNDLAADAERVIRGHKPHEKNLKAVFAAYRYFDNLVSVSEHLRDINRSKLSAWAPAHKFTFCRNTINLERIRKLAELSRTEISAHRVATNESAVQFITVGRLSPEKNHARLISAFALVHLKNAQARLVIVGDGPLMEDLKSQAIELGLADSIRFTGHSENPYALMNESDAFVLSSDYEGQPMVLLEALVVGLPVITTAFGSVEGALPEGVGTIVERSVDGLAGAMSLARVRTQTCGDFDGESYNREVISEFERLFSKE